MNEAKPYKGRLCGLSRNNDGDTMTEINVEQIVKDLAANLGVAEDRLRLKMNEVLTANGPAWTNAGKDEATCTILSARVAGRQLKMIGEKLKKSGLEQFEGMFIRVPPYKDWAQIAYRKTERELTSRGNVSDPLTQAQIKNGALVYFEANGAGYTRYANAGLISRQSMSDSIDEATVNDLPTNHHNLPNGDAFYLIWNNTTPTFPSGDANFKYGAPRPASERERTCHFLGRKVGSSDEPTLITVRANGKTADTQHATFLPGNIGLRPGRDGKVAYAKELSDLVPNNDVASIFSAPPFAVGEAGPEGIVTDMLGGLYPDGGLLPSFATLEQYHTDHKDDKDWWDQWVGIVGEVVHIDPRERGGFTVTLGDLDITSSAPGQDLIIPKSQEHLLTFGLGSQVLIVGQTYKSRDDEMRFTTHGWWCVDSVDAVQVDDESWED